MTLLETLSKGEELTADQVVEFSQLLLQEGVSDQEKYALLKALAEKGETAAELTCFVQYFLTVARQPDFSAVTEGSPTIDVCGTGGDKLNLFNVSTTSMFVIAAAGAKVIKHGNRGITSQSGSSDVLAELGIPLQPSDEELAHALDKANVCFLFAPAFHPAFKAVVGVRAMLAQKGVKTLFNLIGPLLNPAQPEYQLVGVTNEERTADFSTILHALGRKQVYAVTGYTAGGSPVDEFSTMGKNLLFTTTSSQPAAQKWDVYPDDFGFDLASLEDLKGGTPVENAETLIGILNGDIRDARRDIVILNAAAGLTCCELTDSLNDGVKRAEELISSGAALQKLRDLQALYQ